MREKGLATVAVLAYNHERYVRQCLESVVGQTHKALQVVFIDDGSSDRTFELGRKILVNSGMRHTALQTKDRFICANLNLVLHEHARGEYFTVISGDDWWESNNIARKVCFLEAHPGHPLVYSPMSYFYEKTGRSEPIAKPYAEGRIFENLLQGNFIAAHAALVRAAVFDEIGDYDEASRIEDWDMWLRIAKSHPVGFIDESMGFYRIHDKNVSGRAALMLESSIHILGKHLDSPIAHEMRRRLIVQHGVSHAGYGDALKGIRGYGGADLFVLRQLAKLFLRPLRRRPGCRP